MSQSVHQYCVVYLIIHQPLQGSVVVDLSQVMGLVGWFSKLNLFVTEFGCKLELVWLCLHLFLVLVYQSILLWFLFPALGKALLVAKPLYYSFDLGVGGDDA